MSLRLVPKSVTLNDFELRNGHYLALFLPNSVAFVANYVTFLYNIVSGQLALLLLING